MRLLEVDSKTLKEFVDETRVSYAILSHRWEDDEVLFQDIMQGTASQRKGYQKVDNFCHVAKNEGFRYVWIDTCCIDKSSSSELSEAINSMYRWYQHADTCFAYLNDCRYEAVSQAGSTRFQQSKWFTRGWTLQELIAPTEVVFLSAEWREFGTRRSLCSEISAITTISDTLLQNPQKLEDYCAAQKMSWAATRETTRPEDRAYSLMGLFDINMPLLYGEGDKAFLRLQVEIMQKFNDQSILTWRSGPAYEPGQPCSIVARSPDDFTACHTIQHAPRQIDRDLAKNDFVSGAAEFPQEVVGSFIKMKALSLPYSGLAGRVAWRPQQQCPPWIASAYKALGRHIRFRFFDSWIVFLEDCLEQDGTVGIVLSRSGDAFTRIHLPSRVLLPKRPSPSDHPDLKERIFYVRLHVQGSIVPRRPFVHLLNIPPAYRLYRTIPAMCLHGKACPRGAHWCNNEPDHQSLERNPHPLLKLDHSVLLGIQMDFALVFRTAREEIHCRLSVSYFLTSVAS